MNRLWLASSLLMASASVASAGAYLGIGIGPAPAIHDNDHATGPNGRSGRLLVGYSFGRLAFEGAITAHGLADERDRELDGRQLSLSGKYSVPLGSGFEAFGRLGVVYNSVSSDVTDYDFAGRGLMFGGGFEYRLKIPLAPISLFVDYSIAKSTLRNDPMEVDYTTRQWMLGMTLGI